MARVHVGGQQPLDVPACGQPGGSVVKDLLNTALEATAIVDVQEPHRLSVS